MSKKSEKLAVLKKLGKCLDRAELYKPSVITNGVIRRIEEQEWKDEWQNLYNLLHKLISDESLPKKTKLGIPQTVEWDIWFKEIIEAVKAKILIKNKWKESKFKTLWKQGYTAKQAIGLWILNHTAIKL